MASSPPSTPSLRVGSQRRDPEQKPNAHGESMTHESPSHLPGEQTPSSQGSPSQGTSSAPQRAPTGAPSRHRPLKHTRPAEQRSSRWPVAPRGLNALKATLHSTSEQSFGPPSSWQSSSSAHDSPGRSSDMTCHPVGGAPRGVGVWLSVAGRTRSETHSRPSPLRARGASESLSSPSSHTPRRCGRRSCSPTREWQIPFHLAGW